MGMSKAICLGVYIIIDVPSQEELYDKVECPNGHKLSAEPKFCPECGTATVTVEYSRTVAANLYDVFDDAGVDENIFMTFDHGQLPDTLIMVPNSDGGIYLDEVYGDLPLDDLNPEKELEKFYEKYGDAITRLRPYFTTFDVRFGISTWVW